MNHLFKYISFFGLLLLIINFESDILYAEEFGPDEWSQFRINSENNPVFESESNGSLEDIIETDNEIRSTPVIVGNNMYIGNHESGDIYSYNIIEEKMNWKNTAPNWIHSEIIYMNDQLFVGYGNRHFQEDGTRGTGESGMLSLDPETGDILWNFKTKGEVMPTPAYYEGTVYITTGDSHLYAVDPETGEENWSLELGHIVSMSSPNIKDGILYVGGGAPEPYTFSAVDLDTQEMLWQTEFDNVYAGLDDVPPAIYEDLVITTAIEHGEEHRSLSDTYNDGDVKATLNKGVIPTILDFINEPAEDLPEHKIYALNISTGEIEWEDSLGTGEMVPNNKSGAPMVYEDQVFVGSPITKKFYSYNAETGEELWSNDSAVNKAPPVATEDIVYFSDTEGKISAFDVNSGELKGAVQLEGVLAPSGPVIMNDHLIIGSQDHNVYILPTSEILE